MDRNSIVDYLKSKGMDSSLAARKKLAKEQGIEGYNITAAKNTELLNKLRGASEKTSSSNGVKTSPTTTKKEYNVTPEQYEAIKKKFSLTRTPTYADIMEFKDTGSFSNELLGKDGRSAVEKAKAAYKRKKEAEVEKGDTEEAPVEYNNIYEDRDKYLENYIGASDERFDKDTALQLEQYSQREEDLETNIDYYRQDFEKITSRAVQDYNTGLALQNKEMSKSLDFVADLGSKMVGSLEGFGKSRIVSATQDKIESDRRYKLSYDRAEADRLAGKQRTEARYKLDTSRLGESKEQYTEQRDIAKKVKNIEATGEITRYYDSLVTGKTLAEDEAYKRRKNITGGGTGIENIFSY